LRDDAVVDAVFGIEPEVGLQQRGAGECAEHARGDLTLSDAEFERLVAIDVDIERRIVLRLGDAEIADAGNPPHAILEVQRDVEHVPLPCDAATLHMALCRLRLAELIFGFRGSAPLDEVWIRNTLNRMAVLLVEQNLAEIEVNPAIVDENGGVVVDALCVRRGDGML